MKEYEKYEQEMLPNEKKFGIDQLTDHTRIRNDIRHIDRYLNSGRRKKGTNIWNSEWEEGVEDFINGYELAVELQERIKKYKEDYYGNKYTYEKERKTKRLTVVLFVLSLAAAVIIAIGFSGTGEKLIDNVLNSSETQQTSAPNTTQ